MNVEKIRLINFRNYDNLDLTLGKYLNIFIGKNAQGKTNLLESIYICAVGKSYRTNKDNEIIKLNKDEAYAGIKVNIDKIEKIIEVKLDRNSAKRIKVNRIELKKFSELDSGLNVVLFSPDDLKLIKGGPGERRSFIDVSISQIRPIYKYNINKYNKVLLQRNNLLKANESRSSKMNLIEVFDLQLARLGIDVIISRLEFIEKISSTAEKIHKELSRNERLLLSYNTNVDLSSKNKSALRNIFLQQLRDNVVKDLYTGVTSVGPHRDDMQILINNIDARTFASQGQQRTIVLSLKLSEMEIIKEEKGIYPVLLLDDVFSELDKDRRKYLINILRNIQTIVTSTDIIYIDEFKEIEKSVFIIKNGEITR